MNKRNLGAFEVSALGLGCMSMSQSYGKPDRSESERVLNGALDLGYTLLDTAALYSFGHNESLIGEVLGHRRREYVLASKCGLFKNAEGKREINGHPDVIKQTCEDSLKRLQTDVIDLYYLHRVDKNVPIEDSVGALVELKEAGKIRSIGLSEVASSTLRRAHAVHPIAAVQSEYSLWTRVPEAKVLPVCKELGVTFVPFSPLGRGFLTGAIQDPDTLSEKDLRRTMPRFWQDYWPANLKLLDDFQQLASDNGCTMAQLALAWLLTQDDIIVPIPGTKHVAFMEENAAAGDLKITAADLERAGQIINESTVSGERYNETVMLEEDPEV